MISKPFMTICKDIKACVDCGPPKTHNYPVSTWIFKTIHEKVDKILLITDIQLSLNLLRGHFQHLHL